MKKLFTTGALIGLVSLGAGRVQAQGIVPLPFTVKLTAQAQGASKTNSAVEKSSILTIKVTTKDILNLLAIAYDTSFTNVSLVVDDTDPAIGGDLLIIDKARNVLHNVSNDGFISNFFESEGPAIFKGTQNTSTGSFDLFDVFINGFDFTDDAHTNSFSFGGTEQFHEVFSGTTGKFKDSFKLTGSGSGMLGTRPGGKPVISLFMATGTVTGEVRGLSN